MGVTFTSVCVTCGVRAPEVGDFGYIGRPSPDTRKRRGSLQNFGFIYSGLAAIGAVTQEIEEFKAFLDEHGRHRIRQYGDDDAAEDAGEGEDPDDERATGRRIRDFRFKGRGFTRMRYELHCAKCGALYRASNADALRPFKPFHLTPAKIARFRTNAAAIDEENFYRVPGFPLDDLQDLDGFLTDHRGHRIIARAQREPMPPTVQPPAPTLARSWTVPEWRVEENERMFSVEEARPHLALLMKLHHDDAAVRRDAAVHVGALRKRGLLGYLVPLRSDPDPAVRAAAAAAIASSGDPRAVRPLGQALLDESEEVRSAARAGLAAMNVSENQALSAARALRGPYDRPDPRDKVRVPLPGALGDPRVDVRWRACEMLGKRREADTADMLMLALADPSASIRGDAVQALALWKRRGGVSRFVLEMLDDYNIEVVSGAVQALVKINDAATLAEALGHASPLIRSETVRLIGVTKDPRMAGTLIPLLSDPDEKVREAVVWAFYWMGARSVVAALARVALNRSEPESLRTLILSILRHIGGREAIRALIAALRDESKEVRLAAVSALEDADDREGNMALLAGGFRHPEGAGRS